MMVKPNITMNEVIKMVESFEFKVTKINIDFWYFTEDEWQDESGFDIMIHAYGKDNEHKYFTYAEMIKSYIDATYIAVELKEYLDYIFGESKVNVVYPMNI